MNLDTETVRRLRNALLDSDRPAALESTTAVREASIARVSPFVETMYLVMMADGSADDDEHAAIRGAIAMLTRGILDEASIDSLLHDCEQNITRLGAEQRLQIIGAHLSADRADAETAFTLAAAIALADNQVHGAESRLVKDIGEWFGLSERRTAELIASL